MTAIQSTAQFQSPQLCAHQLVEEQASRRPAAVALVHAGGQLTYAELNSAANRIALLLKEQGVGPEVFVGVYVPSSAAAIVGLLAVLKAGGAFVPLDPGFPRDRLEYMISDSRISVVLTIRSFSIQVPIKTSCVLCIDDEVSGTNERPSNLSGGATLRTAACMLYTSGSTGRPKGVVREHRGLVARLAWVPYRPDDVFCHNMSLCFGFSQERLFLPLMMGLPLAVMPSECHRDPTQFVAAAEELAITNVTLVPAFLQQLIDLGPTTLSRLRTLRQVAVGSAPLSAKAIRDFRGALPHAKLINAYGGTEAGSVARGEIISDSEPVSIGRPVPTAEIYVLDENLTPVPSGAIGELCVGGPSIAREYWGLADLTAERFIPNPFSQGDSERLYRTGDLGRFLSDGRIELRGRTDRQVKVRGYRVELGEIEGVLGECENVHEAVVVNRPRGGESRLIAYVVSSGTENVNASSLREFLQSRVPDYMLPSTYVFLSAIPRTQNGKLNFEALPPVEAARPTLNTEYVHPRGALEETIATIWSEVLELDRVGIHDHFLDLGGDSILATRIVAELSRHFTLGDNASSLLDHSTVADLAVALRNVGSL